LQYKQLSDCVIGQKPELQIPAFQAHILASKKTNRSNGEKAGRDFNKHSYVGKMESKHFSPSLVYWHELYV
jgi:hypothetical protein